MASTAKMSRNIGSRQPAADVEDQDRALHSTREQEIRNRAYEIYLQRGGQPGYELEDWLQAERGLSPNLTAVLQELLQNTSNLKVLRQLMTPDVTYVSLNFDNPELKKIEPWTGTHKGPQELSEVFGAIQRCRKALDFKVTDAIEQGSRVEGDKVAYIQFLEDSYGTAGSFKTGGATRFHSDPSGKEVEV